MVSPRIIYTDNTMCPEHAISKNLMYMYVYTVTINEKQGHELKENGEGQIEGFGGRGWKGEKLDL